MFVHLVIGNISLAGLLACLVAVEICLRVISLVVRLWRRERRASLEMSQQSQNRPGPSCFSERNGLRETRHVNYVHKSLWEMVKAWDKSPETAYVFHIFPDN